MVDALANELRSIVEEIATEVVMINWENNLNKYGDYERRLRLHAIDEVEKGNLDYGCNYFMRMYEVKTP